MMRNLGFIFSLLLICGCTSITKEKVDLIVHNGTIYTVDEAFSKAEAMAINQDTIVAVGSEREIMNKYQSPNTVDLRKQFVYPGFNDAHAHYVGYALNLSYVDLTGTTSWEECLERAVEHHKKHQTDWVLGRGWDQNDWNRAEFPTRTELDRLFPNTPVLLKRIDGHAAIANGAALDKAGVTTNTTINGGEIVKAEGVPTGILIDNAVDLVNAVVPEVATKELSSLLLQAQQNCFAVGLTSLTDAGLDLQELLLLDSLSANEQLLLRINAMASDNEANLEYFQSNGRLLRPRFQVRCFKVYADGALGSRGALLLEPYTDRTESTGLLLSDPDHFRERAELLDLMGFQMAVHCIGDSANRLILDIMGEQLKTTNDKRWRIEHAQVVHPEDREKFRDYTIIPSVQPTHATSDAPWAAERLGDRIAYAYPYKSLLDQNGLLPLGTDFPVEGIDPLKTFYAAVFRKPPFNANRKPFQPNEALSRQEALKGMTIWPAIASFEETKKGSLEPRKWADFVVLNKDLMTVPEAEFNALTVTRTYSSGELMYRKEK